MPELDNNNNFILGQKWKKLIYYQQKKSSTLKNDRCHHPHLYVSREEAHKNPIKCIAKLISSAKRALSAAVTILARCQQCAFMA